MKKRTDRTTRQQPAGSARKRTPRHRGRSYRRAWNGQAKLQTLAVPFYKKVSEAPDDLVQRAITEKFAWIQRFIEEGHPRGKLREYARDYAKARGLSVDKIPAYSTLNTWVHRHVAYGLVGLIDQPRRDAGISRTVIGAAHDAVKIGMALGRGTASTLSLVAKVVRGEAPKYHAVRRELRRLEREDPLLAAMAKRGPTAFRDLVELTGAFPRLLAGLRLSIDSTIADRWIRVQSSDGGWKAWRPVLTVVEDVGSRLLVTFNLSLFAIDSGICAAVLGRAMDQRQNYPLLTSTGVPYEITMDKGAEHQAQFSKLLKAIPITVVPRNDNSPRGGAHIERLIGTVTTEVLAQGIGYSKVDRVINPYAPSERDTKRTLASLKYESYKLDVPVSALSTIAELELEILAWAQLYNARPHPALDVNDPRLQALLVGAKTIMQRRAGIAASEVA